MRAAIVMLIAVAGLLVSGARANPVPDPQYSTVTPCDAFLGILTSPYLEGAAPPDFIRFTVQGMIEPDEPFPYGWVEIELRHPGSHQLCPHAVLSGQSDENGRIEFAIAAGGCSLEHDDVYVKINEVRIRVYDRVLSPDLNGDGQVSLVDFILLSDAYVGGTGGCSDFFNDGRTGLNDFIAFAHGWGGRCNR